MPSEQLDILIGMLTERVRDLTAPIEQVRTAFDEETRAFPIDDDVVSEPVEMGGVPAEWVTVPGSSDDRTIFYLHGGGYALGSPRTHRAMISCIARASSHPSCLTRLMNHIAPTRFADAQWMYTGWFEVSATTPRNSSAISALGARNGIWK